MWSSNLEYCEQIKIYGSNRNYRQKIKETKSLPKTDAILNRRLTPEGECECYF